MLEWQVTHESCLQYIQWAGAEGHDVFFTDSGAKQLFKDHIDAMVNRRNTINNRLYKDDPTIFAWDLMNEPRCDCFPDFIPVPDSYVSCRPECAKKVQVSTLGLWLEGSCISHNVDCCIPFTLPLTNLLHLWCKVCCQMGLVGLGSSEPIFVLMLLVHVT